MRVVVVGGGSWGSVFSTLLLARGHDVVLACRDPAQARIIGETGHNPRYVPGVDLSRVDAVMLERAPLAEADLIALAVPSRAFAEVAAALPRRVPVLSLTKGLDPGSGSRLSELLEGRPAAVLSGPNHAEEIAQGLPAAAVIASRDPDFATRLQHALISPIFRVYAGDDVIGVELSGAAKNVVALAAGGVDGLRLGDNAKAGLISRGLREMARLGEACGARAETFSGLAGMGDLIVTCWSRWSRNRRAGELLARGFTPEAASREIGMVVEGLTTTPVLCELARRMDVEMPITEAVGTVLQGTPPLSLVSSLMERQPTTE
jgi:glycerol-3-phosphate dehydrogenase (NAD(P)+)